MEESSAARAKVVLSMFIFGTIGLFVRSIPLPSSIIALVRGVVGMLFLLGVTALRRQKPDGAAIRRNLRWLIPSGAALGFNWILLFEAYRYTTVATATLCYYMAPIFIILVSPLILKERLTARKLLCVGAALVGMVFVSGVPESGLPTLAELRGILLGLAAAVLYACVVLMNKQIHHISAFDKTILQLGISAAVLLPYCLFTQPLTALSCPPAGLAMLLLVGVLHTGIPYYLYFGSTNALGAQSLAIISYIDPVVAVLASVAILHEALSLGGIVGAVLVLGAALVSELG